MLVVNGAMTLPSLSYAVTSFRFRTVSFAPFLRLSMRRNTPTPGLATHLLFRHSQSPLHQPAPLPCGQPPQPVVDMWLPHDTFALVVVVGAMVVVGATVVVGAGVAAFVVV